MDARGLWKRALLVLGVHLALLAVWPLVRPVYAPLFRSLGQFAVGLVDPLPGPIDIVFEPGSGGLLGASLPGMDTVVYLRHGELEGPDASFGASSYFHAWEPTAALLAMLAGATPLASWKRRWRLVGAFALLHLFFTLRCAVAAFYCYSKCDVDGTPLVALGPALQRALHLGWHFVFGEAFTNYLVPLTLWAACVFQPRSSRTSGA